MRKYPLIATLVFASSLALGGCGSAKAPKDADTDKSIALCRQVMKIHSQKMNDGQHKTEKLQDGCKQSANLKTPAQWQCVLDGLNKGGDYIPVSSKCFDLK
jgi:hypothetical protein